MVKTAPVPEDQRYNPGEFEGFQYATNIDRRKGQRSVPMRVLGLGISRTGTASMRQALIDLGYNDCYHFTTPMQENPSDCEMWIEALEAKFEGKGKPYTRADWDKLLGHCQATTDNPTVVFYRELLEAYPEAKVVVTVRDSTEAWQQSWNATIGPYARRYIDTDRSVFVKFYRSLMPMDSQLIRLCELAIEHAPIYRALQQDYIHGTRNASKLHDEYIAELKRIVPKERLLIMNVKEGWKPLCEFLGEEVPAYPFPRKNDTMHFQRNQSFFRDLMNGAANWTLMKIAGTVIVGGAAVAIAMRNHGSVSRFISKDVLSNLKG